MSMRLLYFTLLAAAVTFGGDIKAVRIPENPLITVNTSPSLGDNVNGPSIIRVPDWVKNPLGRYYMYFAHHKGQFIRLAYANSVRGPWKIYEPGVMKVSDTALYRPQPDPDPSPYGVYTHVASPEIYVDEKAKRIMMWFHGEWTDGKQWPKDVAEAGRWMRQNGYSQFTQAAISTDGLHFEARPEITKQPYLRIFQHDGEFYGIARLGLMLRAKSPLDAFETGPDPFRDGPYKGNVRHVALLTRGDNLDVFLSAIGTAPEGIMHTTIPLEGDWTQWKATSYDPVLTPEAKYECPELPTAKSEVGEIYGPAKQLRDPALFEDGGKLYLFYTICGEQGIAAAEVALPK